MYLSGKPRAVVVLAIEICSALKSVFTNNVEFNVNSTGQSITGSGQTGRHGAMPHVLSTEQEYNRILAEINEKVLIMCCLRNILESQIF